jgi:hypothetical protein
VSPTVAETLTQGATDALARLHLQHDGAGRDRLRFRTWVPQGARKRRRRLFVESRLDGVARYVAKLPLDPEDGMVAREWTVLRRLGEFNLSRPRPVRELAPGFVMTYVPYNDFPDRMRQAAPGVWPSLLRRGVETAAALHLHRRPATGVSPVAVGATYLPGLVGLDEPVFRALERATIGVAHGDMGPWNFRIDEHGRVSLIDWEDYRAVGLPALDVLNLVITAALVAYPDYPQRGYDWLYERVFHDQNPYRAAADHALRRYCLLVGGEVEDLVQLLPLFCKSMIHRIQCQGRSTDQLFYGPFAARFAAERTTWSEVAR